MKTKKLKPPKAINKQPVRLSTLSDALKSALEAKLGNSEEKTPEKNENEHKRR